MFEETGQLKVDHDKLVTMFDCINMGGHWQLNYPNFDNIQSALFLLFQIITTEGWVDLMYISMDKTGNGMVPKLNSSKLSSLYFVSFMIIGKMFIMNLFVGIVIEKYNRVKDNMKGYSMMSKEQREWMEAEKLMCSIKLIRAQKLPTSTNRMIAYKIQSSKYFKRLIYFLVIGSIIEISFHSFNSSKYDHYIVMQVNKVLMLFFNVEILIKLYALGGEYFKESHMNKVDFLVVFFNDCALIIDFFQTDSNINNLTN